jgi:predicted RNA methylase
MFPEKAGVDYTKLLVTPEGEYSITKRQDSKQIIRHMKDLAGSLKTKTIADLTGNVGGDTIMFGMNYLHVDSYELNHENFEALKNNVDTFKLKNVHLHEGDSTQIFEKKVDVLYIDPPWGGPDYKEKEKLDLYLGNMNISDYLKEILEEEWKPRFVFIKVPSNYNFEALNSLPHVEKILKYKIRGFYLLGFKVL